MAKNTPHHAPHFLEGEIKLPEIEEKVLAFWDEHKTFEKSLNRQRMVSRSHFMMGRRSLPGFRTTGTFWLPQ